MSILNWQIIYFRNTIDKFLSILNSCDSFLYKSICGVLLFWTEQEASHTTKFSETPH